MGEPRCQDGGGEAMIRERDEDGVEHARLGGRRRPALDQEERELGEGRLAEQLARQVTPHDGDAVRVRRPNRGLEAHRRSLCFATRPVAVSGSSSSTSYWLGTLKAVSR